MSIIHDVFYIHIFLSKIISYSYYEFYFCFKLELFSHIFLYLGIDLIIILLSWWNTIEYSFPKTKQDCLSVFLLTWINILFTYRSQLNWMTFIMYIFQLSNYFFLTRWRMWKPSVIQKDRLYITDSKDLRYHISCYQYDLLKDPIL